MDVVCKRFNLMYLLFKTMICGKQRYAMNTRITRIHPCRHNCLRDLMAQRVARRAEDREVPGSMQSAPKTNFSIMFTLPVESTGE